MAVAVTNQNMHHKSQIHDGFATIRSTRSRARLKDTQEFGAIPASPNRHCEYFTIRRNNKQNYPDNNNIDKYLKKEAAEILKNDFNKPIEPIYAKVSPPCSNETSPVKKPEVHYDSINIKPNSLHRKQRSKHRDRELTEVRVSPIVKVLPENSEFIEDFQFNKEKLNGYTKSTEDFDSSSDYQTDNTLVESDDASTTTIITKDSDDVLKDLPSFHRSPQKYATLNMRRPKTIDLKPSVDSNYYGSLNRSKIGYRSEPNTPVTSESKDFSKCNQLPSPMELKNYDTNNFVYHKKNGVRRSNSEVGSSFSNVLPNYRHSIDVSSMKSHVCCECVTGIQSSKSNLNRSSGFSQTLDTLYESQDPKVGCQTILRSKPPVPWWDLAIKKTRYQSCPLLDEAHVVSAFEQSLSNMSQRLQSLTATAERKDSELTQLRQTIELLRKQSIQAGLTSAHMTSMGIKQDSVTDSPKKEGGKQNVPSANGSNMTRHHSTDSVSSLNSLSSGCSSAQDKKQKKKGWLRSSFTKAFSRNAKISKTAKHASLSHLSSSSQEHGSIGGDHHTIREGSNENSLENSHEILADIASKAEKANDKSEGGAVNGDAVDANGEKCDPQIVDDLKKQLREKDLVLTDIRLEALSSAHQLESLKDTVIKMRNEMLNLKQNNERLQRLVRPRSLAGSHASLSGVTPPGPAPSGNTPLGSGPGEDARRFSAADAQRSSNDTHNLDLHNQPLDLDFNCITSTPTMEYGSKISSPCDRATVDLYRASQDLSLTALEDNELMNGSPGMDDDPLLTGGRLSGVDCDISSVLPPPKCRELAMGETYDGLGLTENSADVVDGKKIAISVYLGQPDTFPRYYEEMCESLNNCDSRFYSNRSSVAYAPEGQDVPGSPRLNHGMNEPTSPGHETNDYQSQPNKSNTNSLKSNKSAHSVSFKYNGNDHATTVNCNEFTIAYTYISGKSTWQNLDYTVRKTFRDYLSRIDPGTNLGLNTDSITSYHLGEATRGPEIGFPELLPCGYIIGTVRTLYICLQGVGSLAFDSLIPKNIVYRYVSLLSEHRRVILCGPSGTGKSYLATRLAEFHVARTAAHLNPAEAIATFNVEHKSSKELRQYLSNVAEQCVGDAALPSVLILDNLHHASALADVFSGLLGARRTNLPCIIGTMSQATCNTTNLQLHHNFRWLLTANHMEPVKGFLARYLRRKQVIGELSGVPRCARMTTVLEWLPGVWQHVNSFLEAHSSSDVTVGPRLFLGCPLDLTASQAWFTSVWNQSVIPYLIEAAREGVALYGRRGAWADPVKHVRDTYPWADQQPTESLRGITLEDIGLDDSSNDTTNTNNQDPLLNMLMRLREAANYSGNHSQDSDNASLDSNLTHDSSVGNEL